MFISPKYILSDRLQAGLSFDSLLLIIGVSFGAIFMSVNIAERPTFEKKNVRFDKRLFSNVLAVYFLFHLSNIHFEGRI